MNIHFSVSHGSGRIGGRAKDIEFVGVGIYGQPDLERERMIVISTYPGSPAEYGGIQDHDSILLVDGQTINENFSNSARTECLVVLTVQSPRGAATMLSVIIQECARCALFPQNGSKIGYFPLVFDETIPEKLKTH
jgi:hypothetical protein